MPAIRFRRQARIVAVADMGLSVLSILGAISVGIVLSLPGRQNHLIGYVPDSILPHFIFILWPLVLVICSLYLLQLFAAFRLHKASTLEEEPDLIKARQLATFWRNVTIGVTFVVMAFRIYLGEYIFIVVTVLCRGIFLIVGIRYIMQIEAALKSGYRNIQ